MSETAIKTDIPASVWPLVTMTLRVLLPAAVLLWSCFLVHPEGAFLIDSRRHEPPYNEYAKMARFLVHRMGKKWKYIVQII